jgi:hypothetical protein
MLLCEGYYPDFFVCLFVVAGWGEQRDVHGWLCTGEDMAGTPGYFIFYEIVRKTTFKFLQHQKWIQVTLPFATHKLLCI